MHPDDYALFERIGLLRFLRQLALRQYPRITVPRELMMALLFIRASRAGPVWATAMTRLSMRWAKTVGVNRVFVALSRSSCSFISPAHFEEFVFPEIKIIAGMLIESNTTPVFHCDTRWKPRLEIFKRLPARRCIIEFDGETDMAHAKAVLGGPQANVDWNEREERAGRITNIFTPRPRTRKPDTHHTLTQS